MLGLGWFELIQLHILITTEVYVRVVPMISRFPVSDVYPSASCPLLVRLPWLLLVLCLLDVLTFLFFYCTSGFIQRLVSVTLSW